MMEEHFPLPALDEITELVSRPLLFSDVFPSPGAFENEIKSINRVTGTPFLSRQTVWPCMISYIRRHFSPMVIIRIYCSWTDTQLLSNHEIDGKWWTKWLLFCLDYYWFADSALENWVNDNQYLISTIQSYLYISTLYSFPKKKLTFLSNHFWIWAINLPKTALPSEYY